MSCIHGCISTEVWLEEDVDSQAERSNFPNSDGTFSVLPMHDKFCVVLYPGCSNWSMARRRHRQSSWVIRSYFLNSDGTSVLPCRVWQFLVLCCIQIVPTEYSPARRRHRWSSWVITLPEQWWNIFLSYRCSWKACCYWLWLPDSPVPWPCQAPPLHRHLTPFTQLSGWGSKPKSRQQHLVLRSWKQWNIIMLMANQTLFLWVRRI